MKIPEALKYALCAVGFYRGRHGHRPRYKKSRRAAQTVRVDVREHRALARKYIAEARAAGFDRTRSIAQQVADHNRAVEQEARR